MPGPAFLATFLVTNLRETTYPDESQLRRPGFAAPPSADLSIDGIDGILAHSQPFEDALQIATGSLSPKLVFDDLRERFSSIFEPREYLVGFHVNGDRFYGHALIMHLAPSPVKSSFEGEVSNDAFNEADTWRSIIVVPVSTAKVAIRWNVIPSYWREGKRGRTDRH